MIRVVAVVALICACGAFIYWQGGKATRTKANETKLIRGKDISDAVKDSENTPAWRGQLRDRHK